MKKILLAALFSLSAIISFAQFPSTFYSSNANTNSFFNGGVGTRYGFQNAIYFDTAAANTQSPQLIKNIPGFQIFTSDDNNFWIRSSDATYWLKINTATSGIPTWWQVLTATTTASPSNYSMDLGGFNFGLTNANILTLSGAGSSLVTSSPFGRATVTATNAVLLKSDSITLGSGAVFKTDFLINNTNGNLNIKPANNLVSINTTSGLLQSGYLSLSKATGAAAYLSLYKNVTSTAQINFETSIGVNVTSPVNGDLWYNGTNLYFRNASTTLDLLVGGAATNIGNSDLTLTGDRILDGDGKRLTLDSLLYFYVNVFGNGDDDGTIELTRNNSDLSKKAGFNASGAQAYNFSQDIATSNSAAIGATSASTAPIAYMNAAKGDASESTAYEVYSKGSVLRYKNEGSAANTSALLQLESTTMGLLISRMTTAQRDAITTPATGLFIYNTSTNAFNYYSGGWISLASGGSYGIDNVLAVGQNLSANRSIDFFANNLTFLPDGGYFNIETDDPGNVTTHFQVTGEAMARFQVQGDGHLEWSNGTTGVDVGLTRLAAAKLNVNGNAGDITNLFISSTALDSSKLSFGNDDGTERAYILYDYPNNVLNYFSTTHIFQGDVIPKLNSGNDLGSLAFKWKDLYLREALKFGNSTNSNLVNIQSGVTSTSYSITLPTAVAGGNGYALTSTTGGVTSWSNLSGTYLPLAGGTMVGNIIATDNLYDIGASGATRFRTLYLGTGATIPALTATTINGNTFTAGTGVLTIAASKTLTASNTLTLTATDGSTLAIGTGGTLGSNAYTSTAYAPIASPTFTGTITMGAATQTLILAGTSFTYRGTNGGSNVTGSQFLSDLGNSISTAGSLAVLLDNTAGGIGFTHANGTRRILGSTIGITNLTNTAGSEANDFFISTQSAGTAATTKFTVGSTGNITVANGNLTLGTAGNRLYVTEGTGGFAGQTTLVAGTKAITITGVTTASRAFVTLVAQGGTSTTVYQYEAVCTANTLTISAVSVVNALVNTDTSTINYFVIN